jgi:aspartate aminotransferase
MLRLISLRPTVKNRVHGTRAFATIYDNVPLGPPDAILGLNEAFNKDENPKKVSLGVGAYRDDDGKPWVLPSVREAEKRILESKMPKEYLGIAGLPSFVKKSTIFAYGKEICDKKNIAAVQTLSGTGGCRIASAFISKFKLSTNQAIYQPVPTWGNHVPIFTNEGMEVKTYPYYDRDSNSLDIKGIVSTLENAPDQSAFLLHACAHNPTGLDPTQEQWKEFADIMKRKNHLAFFDCAYQGFASGDAELDAFAVRHFVNNGNNVCLAQSYAKNFGLYGERVGCFSVVCDSKEVKEQVESQLKILIRPMYSNPPMNGARIVDTVLGDPALEAQWRAECKSMADRIHAMRSTLVDGLKRAGSTKDWSHITAQIGMFCFTGISTEQVDRLRYEYSIYLTKDGRISMAGVNSKNVDYISGALHEVTK